MKLPNIKTITPADPRDALSAILAATPETLLPGPDGNYPYGFYWCWFPPQQDQTFPNVVSQPFETVAYCPNPRYCPPELRNNWKIIGTELTVVVNQECFPVQYIGNESLKPGKDAV